MNFKTFIPSPCRILIFIVLDYSAMIQLSLQSDPAREGSKFYLSYVVRIVIINQCFQTLLFGSCSDQ